MLILYIHLQRTLEIAVQVVLAVNGKSVNYARCVRLGINYPKSFPFIALVFIQQHQKRANIWKDFVSRSIGCKLFVTENRFKKAHTHHVATRSQ